MNYSSNCSLTSMTCCPDNKTILLAKIMGNKHSPPCTDEIQNANDTTSRLVLIISLDGTLL